MQPADDFDAVSADLFVWEKFDPRVKTVLSSCAIRVDAGLVLVDPIELGDEAWERLSGGGPPVAIVLTNANHERAAWSCRVRFEVPLFAHADAMGEMQLEADKWVREGERILEELEVIELGGAGAGEMALHSPRGSGVLLVGDALINLDSDGVRPLPAKYCRDAKRAMKSLRKLLNFRFEILTFAHGLPIVSSARARLEGVLAQHHA